MLTRRVHSYLAWCMQDLSKPQRPYFCLYLVGLLWTSKFFSIRETACRFGKGVVDGLHHFITHGSDHIDTFTEHTQRHIAHIVHDQHPCLALDDTAIPRQGDTISGIGIHHGAKGLVKGLCAVTAIIITTSQRFAWAVHGYYPKKTCTSGTFTSKVEIAQSILTHARQYFTQLTVLMDSWYSCAPVLNTIINAGWTLVAAIKSNRIVYLNGTRIAIASLARRRLPYGTVRIGNKRFRIARLIVFLPHVGDVALFICRYDSGIGYIITNDCSMSASCMARTYRLRFLIELFHKEMKQLFHFGALFMRSRLGTQQHWMLCLIAYNTIVLWNASRSKSFRDTLRSFRASVPYAALLRFSRAI